MVGAGGSQWSNGVPDTSQNASGTSRTTNGKEGEQPRKQGKTNADWYKIIDCLNNIVGDLKKPDEDAPRIGILREAQDALLRVHALWTQATCSTTPLEERLQSLEKKIDSWG